LSKYRSMKVREWWGWWGWWCIYIAKSQTVLISPRHLREAQVPGRAVHYTNLHAYFKTLHDFQSRKLYTPLYITLLYIKLYTARCGAYFIFGLIIRETGKTLNRRPMAREQAQLARISVVWWVLENRCSLWQPLWLRDHHWRLSLPWVKWTIPALHVFHTLKFYTYSSFYSAKRLFGCEFLQWENLVWPPNKQTNKLASLVVKWM
jgi:hypothetical protein